MSLQTNALSSGTQATGPLRWYAGFTTNMLLPWPGSQAFYATRSGLLGIAIPSRTLKQGS
jgi:hypothetical protein